MIDQEDIDELISEILEDETLTWIEKKAEITMIDVLVRGMEYGDHTVHHECPKCNKVWRESPTDDGAFQFRGKIRIEEKGLLDIDGNKIEYERYPERLCPYCGEQTVDGRRKGPLVKIDIEGKELFYDDLKCQVCGRKDMDFKPDNMFADCGTLICNTCNSFNYIELEDDGMITELSYREDLQTKEFNENFEEMAKIILESNPIEIK